MEQKGITLIGMPTSGKSTVGKELEQRLGWPLLDVDRWMERHEGMPVGQIVQERGRDYTLALETRCLREAKLSRTIISTPGSIIYSDELRDPLRMQTDVVWLDVPLDHI